MDKCINCGKLFFKGSWTTDICQKCRHQKSESEKAEISSAASMMGKKAAATNIKKGKDYFSALGKRSAEKRRLDKLKEQGEKE